MVKALIVGAAGRMGLTLARVIRETEGIKCIGAIEAPGHPHLGSDLGELAGIGPMGIRITDNLPEGMKKADVVIDFSTPLSSMYTLELASYLQKPAVVGTTGFDESQKEKIRQFAQNFPCVLSPNMSLGVNLLFRLVEITTRVLGPGYDIEIVEFHHKGKRDAPSGTALRIAERIATARGKNLDTVAIFGRKGLCGPRSSEEIGILALRGGDVVGEHVVIFATEGERVELIHRASSRETFARGAVKAALWVVGKPPGLYDMEDVLGLKDRGV